MVKQLEPLTESYFYILLCLYESANHGYGIMQRTDELTDGRVRIGSGTMYGAISKMIKKEYITEQEGSDEKNRRRIYTITELGKDILRSDCDRIDEMAKNIKSIMDR